MSFGSKGKIAKDCLSSCYYEWVYSH